MRDRELFCSGILALRLLLTQQITTAHYLRHYHVSKHGGSSNVTASSAAGVYEDAGTDANER